MLPVTVEKKPLVGMEEKVRMAKEWQQDAFYHPLVILFRGGGITQRITN